MNLYEILQNSDRVGEGMTHFERLFAQKVGGGKINEISGVPPLRYIGDGRPLTDYLISGNTVQDGTPSPDAPVDVVGCGVRTGNLFDITSSAVTATNCTMAVNNDVLTQVNTGGNSRTTWKINDLQVDTDYTLSVNFINPNASECQLRIYDSSNNSVITRSSPSRATTGNLLVTFTAATSTHYIRIYSNTSGTANSSTANFTDIMLNLGSTALPYEPYGIKLPMTVNGTEYPIYLGQVETTRRIKKLVLTGEEASWSLVSGNAPYRILLPGIVQTPDRNIVLFMATHYPAVPNSESWSQYTACVSWPFSGSTNIKCLVFRDASQSTLEDFKSYLAAQYANGTPVTVWYVLATEETAIVNEPLMKIGDYADTVSFAQTGVTIPTVNGENVLDVPTTVPPSEVWIRGKIKEV